MGIKKIALGIIVAMVFLGVFSPYLVPYDPDDFSAKPLLPPGREHLLGTNAMGQDNFSALLAGFRTTTGIAFLTAFLTLFVGTTMAVAAAYFGGTVDWLIVRLTDVFIIVPDTIVIMIFATFAGPRVMDVVLVMVFFSWSRICRVLRTRSLVIVKQEEIQYTFLLKGGLGDVGKKMWPHLYPAAATLFIQQCGRAAVMESTLSFLGVGDPTLKSWGRTIKAALEHYAIFWDYNYLWWLLPPIACLLLFILSLSLLTFDFEKS